MENLIFLISLFFLIFLLKCSEEIENLEIIKEKNFLNSSTYEYLLYEENKDKINVKLVKKISKIENNYTSKNYLTINNDEKKEVEFENIGSFYNIDNKIIICPKGKFHPIDYSNDLNETIPENFDTNGNWDLKCYQNQEGKINIYYSKCGENCKTTDEEGCKCVDCYDSFYLDDYDCKKCDSNCKSCIGTANNCTECNGTKFLYQNECLDCANNCVKFDSDNCQCLSCGKGFENIKNQCIKCDTGESSCSEYVENKCICTQCSYGSYLNKSTNLCNYCDNNCKSCEDTATKCTSCNDTHFLEDNKCIQCTECNETEEYTCKCISCKEGKYIEKSQCKECEKKCKSCFGIGLCTNCNDGYYLYQFNCNPCYESCKTCNSGSSDPKNQLCESCKPNYIFLDNNCLEKCPEGYYEINNTCKLCNQLCKTSGENCNRCESCFDGYYLVKGEYRCNKCDEHCSTCSAGESGNNQNCETCNAISEYKYFVNATGFGKNCVQSCPDGTVLEGNSTCILKSQENKDNKKEKILLITLSIILSVLVLGIILYIIIFFIKRKRRIVVNNNKCDDKLIKEINKDLNLYESFT